MPELMICTIDELARFIAEKLNLSHPCESEFPECDFAIIDVGMFDKKDLENKDLVYFSATGWHGIKAISSGFDSDCLNILSDYYGGGCASFSQIQWGHSLEEVITKIKNNISNTLCIRETLEDSTLLIVEILGGDEE